MWDLIVPDFHWCFRYVVQAKPVGVFKFECKWAWNLYLANYKDAHLVWELLNHMNTGWFSVNFRKDYQLVQRCLPNM